MYCKRQFRRLTGVRQKIAFHQARFSPESVGFRMVPPHAWPLVVLPLASGTWGSPADQRPELVWPVALFGGTPAPSFLILRRLTWRLRKRDPPQTNPREAECKVASGS